MNTGVPSGTRRIRTARSSSAARRQPAEAAAPIEPGASVPWIAMRLPPCQPGRRVRLVAGQREDAAAVVGAVVAAGSLSVTAKRPVGVGEPGRPTATRRRLTTRPPRRSSTSRLERSACSDQAVRDSQRRVAALDPCEPAVGRAVVTSPSQRRGGRRRRGPRASRTRCVRRAVSTAPPGRERRRGARRTASVRCPRARAARSGRRVAAAARRPLGRSSVAAIARRGCRRGAGLRRGGALRGPVAELALSRALGERPRPGPRQGRPRSPRAAGRRGGRTSSSWTSGRSAGATTASRTPGRMFDAWARLVDAAKIKICLASRCEISTLQVVALGNLSAPHSRTPRAAPGASPGGRRPCA